MSQSKLTYEQIINAFKKQNISAESIAYTELEGDIPADFEEEKDWDAAIENVKTEVGGWITVRDEDDHDQNSGDFILHFPLHGVYIRVEGIYYSSYEGYEVDSASFEQVIPYQKTVLTFKTV